MDKSERTARMAQNLLCGIPNAIRHRRTAGPMAASEAIGGIRRIAVISTIRTVASCLPPDVTPDGLLDELLAISVGHLAASGREAGASLLREMYCLDEPCPSPMPPGLRPRCSHRLCTCVNLAHLDDLNHDCDAAI